MLDFRALPQPLWVLGTDTGVGKTFVATRVAQAWAAQGPVCYRKPFQTGVGGPQDPGADASAVVGPNIQAETFVTLREPLSPLAAAQAEGRVLDLAAATAWCRRPVSSPLVLEGVGGVLVPLAPQVHFLAWATDLGIPCLLVARGGLGTLNHTLLSAEALMMRGWRVAAVLLNPGADHTPPAIAEANAALLRGFLPLPVEVLA